MIQLLACALLGVLGNPSQQFSTMFLGWLCPPRLHQITAKNHTSHIASNKMQIGQKMQQPSSKGLDRNAMLPRPPFLLSLYNVVACISLYPSVAGIST